MLKLAVLLTCHNRVEKSKHIVNQVLEQTKELVDTTIIAVDDGSTDGTGQELENLGAQVVRGDGSLFWAGGMRTAHVIAQQGSYDFVLWLNDDVTLAEAAIPRALATARAASPLDVWVGSTRDPRTQHINYGGRAQAVRRPLSFELVENLDAYQADTFNGNFVLFSHRAAQIPFPSHYRHGYADLVYGWVLNKAGFRIRLLPQTIGFTESNSGTGRMFDPSVNLAARLRFALSPFGIPLRDQFRFARDVGASRMWALRSYVRVFFPRQHA